MGAGSCAIQHIVVLHAGGAQAHGGGHASVAVGGVAMNSAAWGSTDGPDAKAGHARTARSHMPSRSMEIASTPQIASAT